MSTRYRLGPDGHTLWDEQRQIAVITGELSDGAKIVRALNERDCNEQLATMIDHSSIGLAERARVQAIYASASELTRLKQLRMALVALIKNPHAADMTGTQWAREVGDVLDDHTC